MDVPRHNLGVLTEKQKRFAFEYCRDFVATKAYERAGYSPTATGGANKLLNDPEVLAEIEEIKESKALVASLDKDWVLKQWMRIASAQPSDLVQTLTFPCAKCWENVEDLAARGAMSDPNPFCTVCKGTGLHITRITPTAQIPERSKILFAGAVQTKDGIKIQMRDQEGALKSLANYLGLERNRTELSGPNGAPIALTAVRTPDQYSEDELALILAGQAPLLLGDGA